MTQPLPKWIQTRYATLWSIFGDNEFTFEKAEKVLGDNKTGRMEKGERFFCDCR